MIITKINKSLTLLEGFTTKTYTGLYIETHFDFEDKVFNSLIREWDGVNIGSEDIPALITMKRINISSETDLEFININNNIIDTLNNWVKERVKAYALSRINPFTGQPLFTANDIIQEIV